MKCAIIGGSVLPDQLPPETIQMMDAFAQYCAYKDIEILTGGCDGYPFLIGKKCLEHRVRVTGYSAAKNEADHINLYRHPLNGCSTLHYLDCGEENQNLRFLIRSLPLISNSNIVIALEGNWGTLFELIAGVMCGKKVVLWQGFGGICDDFQGIYDRLSRECHYHYGDELYCARDLDQLTSILSGLLIDAPH